MVGRIILKVWLSEYPPQIDWHFDGAPAMTLLLGSLACDHEVSFSSHNWLEDLDDLVVHLLANITDKRYR